VKGNETSTLLGSLERVFFITAVYLQSVQNTVSKWEETETNGEEESSVAPIHMEGMGTGISYRLNLRTRRKS
jgi:hypothetical protein